MLYSRGLDSAFVSVSFPFLPLAQEWMCGLWSAKYYWHVKDEQGVVCMSGVNKCRGWTNHDFTCKGLTCDILWFTCKQ